MALMIGQNPAFQMNKFIVVKYRSIGEGLPTGAWITQGHCKPKTSLQQERELVNAAFLIHPAGFTAN